MTSLGAPLDALATLGLPPTAAAAIAAWSTDPRYAEDRAALDDLLARARDGDSAAVAELEDAFAGPLPIGTGGRRGAVGVGPNRMNATLVRETAHGVAMLVRDEGVPAKVAVVYDTRTHSRTFALAVADQLAACDLEVLLLDAPRPTPELAFLVRRERCGAGIVISASHNPPGDNGIKIYGPDGAQVLGARDRALMAAIERAMTLPLPTSSPSQRATIAVARAEEVERFDAPYHAFVHAQGVVDGDLAASGVKVAFTPLHGVGHFAVVPILRARGVEVIVVEDQLPDGGRFATVPSANPELPESLARAIEVAREHGADLVLATDPDADRLGACARTSAGNIEFIDGNRLGALMLDHVLRHATLPNDGWVLTTLVTSPLVATLARAAGVDVVDDLLVGFKHHAGMMAESERPVVFACEESHGYLRGNEVHDKDGAIAALLLSECAAEAKRSGHTLFDALDRIFSAHGYHRESTANLYAYGAAGRDAIAGLVESWRREPPREFGGLSVVSMEDRGKPRSTGSPTRDLPGNVLVFELAAEGGLACRLVVRPSGTEPKAKVYALGHGPGAKDAAALASVRARVDAMVEGVLADARARADALMRGDAAGAARKG
jgi:phosphoglucomutase/phosphomannomutase